MAYSPNYTQRPGFVKACANRKRFVSDILRAISDPKDYKTLFEYLFPSKPTPNVKLPQGYKTVLEGALLNTKLVSETKLENIRTVLMTQLRNERSTLSINLEPENRLALQKVVMVTSPDWVSTFQSTEKAIETFTNDVDKLPLPHQNTYLLKGPVTFTLMLLGLMIISLVVRIMMSQVSGFTDAQALKQAVIDPAYGRDTYKTFTGDASNSLTMRKLFNNNVYNPNVIWSYAVIPGFVLSTLFQLACLILYIALLPIVLLFSNMSKMFGMRNMQLIQTVESVLFSQNSGYQSTPRFTMVDQRRFFGELAKYTGGSDKTIFKYGKFYDIDQLAKAMQTFINDTQIIKLKILFKKGKIEDFVKTNLKRFMTMNEEGLFMLTQDAFEQAIDAYNLIHLGNTEDLWNIVFKAPKFLSSIMHQSFSYPILVKIGQNDLHYKIIPEYFWEAQTYRYLEIPSEFPDDKIPRISFRVQKNSLTGAESVDQVSVRFNTGSGIQLVDTFKPPAEDNIPKYLLVRDNEKTNPKQMGPNLLASFTRSIGMFSGTIGSGAFVLMIMFAVVSFLENLVGKYSHYNSNMFQKMTIITSDAYYDWIRRDDVSKTDIGKFNLFTTRTNNRIKIVDMSGGTSDSKKIETLIDTYNNDVASTTFIQNQLFMRSLYLMFWLTLPFVAAWILGVFNTRAVYDILGTKGLDGFGDLRAWLPTATIGVSLATLISAAVQMSSAWFKPGGEKANLWETVDETPKDRPNAPMKEANSTPDKLKTHSFLTTSGAEVGSSLDRSQQQHRRIHGENMFNIKAFERTRVIFITDSNDLHGFYMNHVNSTIKHQHVDTGIHEQMKTDNNYSYAIMIIFGVILTVFIIGAALVGIEFVKTPGQTGTGVDSTQANLLKSGKALNDMLFGYLAAMNQPKWFDTMGISRTLVSQGGLLLLSIFVLFYSNVSPDNEIVAGHGTGKHTKATQLAYGSLAYIDHDAKPITH